MKNNFTQRHIINYEHQRKLVHRARRCDKSPGYQTNDSFHFRMYGDQKTRHYLEMLFPVKLFFKKEGKINPCFAYRKVEFITDIPLLKAILKQVK